MQERAPPSTFGTSVLIALFVGSITLGVAGATSKHARELRQHRGGASVRLVGQHSTYSFRPSSGRVVARSTAGGEAREVDLSLVVDGEARPLAFERRAHRVSERNAFGAVVPIEIGEESFDGLITLRVDPATDAFVADLSVSNVEASQAHTFALRAEMPTGGRSAFVEGVGELGDLGTVQGRAVELDVDSRAIAFASSHGELDVGASAAEELRERGTPMSLTVTTHGETPTDAGAARSSLHFVLADSPTEAWRTVYAIEGEPVARVTGRVTGATGVARVYGLDAEGLPRIRVRTSPDGRFDLVAPPSVTEWYAALDAARTSSPVAFTPGTSWDLRLDVSPGGELAVKVTDADTGAPLTARLLVHGLDGTLDPSFGPDYRASGAGPIIDALRGDVTTPLPAGRYRVSATKGIEWSIDTRTIDVVSGHTVSVDLAPRHVVDTPGVVGCDLHVHARPSFDSPVTPEDRVLSLVAAGVDFAVPSEHNIVGDYGPALTALDLTGDLATVTGVEITTFAPRFGHFGLFPYPVGKAPPYKHTNINAVFNAAHRGDPSRVLQVNHPHLGGGIGYFEVIHFDPKKPLPRGMRTDFDTIEVYNGYEMQSPERVELTLRDWFALLNLGHKYAGTGSSDSHRIQYQWAGYPRTMAIVGEASSGEGGQPIDTAAVVAAVKRGSSFVTTGPIIDFELEGGHPGDSITVDGEHARGHLRVRAAPWIDVTEADVLVGGQLVKTIPIESRPEKTGPEVGAKEDLAREVLRYESDVDLDVPRGSTWVIVEARGSRTMDDVLPFMPIKPMAITNPVYVARP